MFTGIVEELGAVESVTFADSGADARITIRGPKVTSDVAHGDSIAVSGVCLTVVDSDHESFTADLMAETLRRTTAGQWTAGTRVNLERSVMPTTRLGGHLVQGHIDGVGTVVSRVAQSGYDDVTLAVPRAVGRYLASKGAVAVDGISLTVIDVADIDVADEAERTVITLGIIPETRAVTTMGRLEAGDTVNIEVDVMAKYAERLLATRYLDGSTNVNTGMDTVVRTTAEVVQ